MQCADQKWELNTDKTDERKFDKTEQKIHHV